MPTPCGPLLAALVLGLAILYCVEQQGGFGAGSGGASFAAGSRGAADAAASAGAAASAAGQREESLEARLERRAAEAKTVGLKRRVVPAAEVKKSAALKPKKASASKQRRAQSGRNAVHLPLDITRKPSSENRHWSLASLLKREDKIFLTENIAGGAVETFVVRAPRGSTVTAFVLATADIMGSAYREEVRVMEILPVGLPRKTLVPWNVYGSIPRGRDQASPKEYTPAIVGVTTDAVEFEVSVRHDYRGHGVAAPGLAIFRAEGTAP